MNRVRVGAAKAGLVGWIGYDLFRLVEFTLAGFGRVTEIILIAAMLAILVNVVRRPPPLATRIDAQSLAACALALGALTAALALVDPPFHPTLATDVIGTAGALLLLVSVLALGTSFSVLPTAIRIRAKGPFALVRHPIYAAYILLDLSIALSSVHWVIALAAALEVAALAWRARIEERLLEGVMPEYSHYLGRVKYRFVPRLY